MAFLHESQIGIVLPKHQAVFRPGGKHPIRFAGSPGHQVVDHHPHICLGSIQDKPGSILNLTGGIDARPHALGRSLLITGSAVDLPGHIQALDPFGL